MTGRGGYGPVYSLENPRIELGSLLMLTSWEFASGQYMVPNEYMRANMNRTLYIDAAFASDCR
jgi:hypothetical protein